MKRGVALILSIIMLVAVMLPVQSFAAEDSKGLEKAIKIAKEKFVIPDDFKFDYNVSTQNNKNVWYLYWNSKDNTEGISVRIDENGTILNYSRYKPGVYPRQKKFPKVSKNEAKAIADSFIKRINPAAFSELRYQDNNRSSLDDKGYEFIYVRSPRGIPFYNNTVNVRVNSETGEVEYYYCNWDDTLKFPEVKGIISMEQAQSAYKEKLGLKLAYNYAVDDELIRTFAVYIPKYDSYNYCIDAFTGDKIETRDGYYGPYYDYGAGGELAKSAEAVNRETSLTPEELKAVEEASKLLTVQQAEKIARNTKVLELTNKFKLTHSSLSRNWPDRNSYIWYLSFDKEATEDDKEYRYAGVSIDAKSGEIISFYLSNPYKEGETAKCDETAARKAVEEFLKKFNPDKFAQTEYDKSQSDEHLRYAGKEGPRDYRFVYVRKVNGVPFTGNAITVVYDAVNCRIINYNMEWFEAEFPAVDKVMSLDDAYEKLFGQIGLELQYKLKYSDSYARAVNDSQSGAEVVLAYALKPGKPTTLDANTGEILGYNGKPYKEIKPVEYTDIAGHFAEKQIAALAEYGISLGGTEFRPDENIKQKDFFILLSKIMDYYYWTVISSESGDKDIDNLYSFLIREGVVKPEEKSYESPVTREEAVKFIIRALKYTEVADIKGIYKPLFQDQDSINPDLEGYVTIAAGLKIVSGNNGCFYPKNKLTRAEAAVMIYNCLQR